jgi:EmrB/QacA subfamily drug resistance transporter
VRLDPSAAQGESVEDSRLTTTRPAVTAPESSSGDRRGTTSTPPLVGRRRRSVLLVTTLAAFMAFLDVTIVNVAFPDIERSFPGVSRSALSWVLNGYNVVLAALLMPVGRYADLFGRRRTFLLGLLIFTSASGLCASASWPWALIAARVLQAVGAAAVIPTVVALVLLEFSAEERIRAIAVLGAAAGVAAALGPSLGGLLIHLGSWRLVFVVNLPLGAAAWLMGVRVLRETHDLSGATRPDLVGIVLLIAGVGLVALAIVQGDQWHWLSVPTTVAGACGLALLALALLRASGHPSPAIEMSLLRLRSVRWANAAMLLFALAIYSKVFLDVLFLDEVWRDRLVILGLTLSTGPLITAGSALPAGKLATLYGNRRIGSLGALVYASGCLWFVLVPGKHVFYLGAWLPGSVLTGIGNAMAFPTLTSAAVMDLAIGRYGLGSALNAASRQLGAVLGIAVAVAILGTHSLLGDIAVFKRGWTMTAIVAALAGVVTLGLSGGQGVRPDRHA